MYSKRCNLYTFNSRQTNNTQYQRYFTLRHVTSACIYTYMLACKRTEYSCQAYKIRVRSIDDACALEARSLRTMHCCIERCSSTCGLATTTCFITLLLRTSINAVCHL